MKSINLLKLMIDLFFFGSILAFLITLVFSINSGSFNIAGQTFDKLNPSIIALIIFSILRPLFFFWAVFHIKLLADSFIKDEIFTEKTSRNLKNIGYGFILYSVSESIGEYLNAQINNLGDTIMSFNFMGFKSAWFQFTLGLLFIFMDKVFREAKTLQVESELTI